MYSSWYRNVLLLGNNQFFNTVDHNITYSICKQLGLKYSICVTNYNNAPTLRQSVESILNQIDSSFEIVVVYNKSTDGSQLVLREHSDSGKLKLISARCSRGEGQTN